jgi:hypothetical protein
MTDAPQETVKRKPGRPALAEGIKAIRVQVSLDQPSIDRAKALGGGNVSAGVRIALQPAESVLASTPDAP